MCQIQKIQVHLEDGCIKNKEMSTRSRNNVLAYDTLYNHEFLHHLCIFHIVGYSLYPKCVLDPTFPPPILSPYEVLM
jgi:hypothetical protein